MYISLIGVVTASQSVLVRALPTRLAYLLGVRVIGYPIVSVNPTFPSLICLLIAQLRPNPVFGYQRYTNGSTHASEFAFDHTIRCVLL